MTGACAEGGGGLVRGYALHKYFHFHPRHVAAIIASMRKIISLYQRNYDGDRLVRDEVVPGAEWVIEGEGEATRKLDGTCCMVRDGKLYRRYDLKPGKVAPANFEVAQKDEVTGKSFGWVPVGGGPEDKWHREAWERGNYLSIKFQTAMPPPDGTYELIGPKVQGNPENVMEHMLVEHGYMPAADRNKFEEVPRNFEGIRDWLEGEDVEGIVWHHDDGRMVKIKAKDFGIKR